MRHKKTQKKRFSCIPTRIRDFFTKKINAICNEEGVDKSEIGIVIVDALEKIQELAEQSETPNWKKIQKEIYMRVITHTQAMEPFMVPN